jgi:hypothetical protein
MLCESTVFFAHPRLNRKYDRESLDIYNKTLISKIFREALPTGERA